ncbi:arginine--tRNA ligase [Thermomicrobiaceae bacterium CFH 74404]|uniref:Arginine--tRNA ligase n=1 Tax=Thermalbibacter longus TaxID=2951981 RepID=A0AA41WD83_9BACT|nr:arginine--tRNA ligase [Thermalbibacter longus]MCM8748195.1 arginine--tRNA ligase [Thermalbibacter longus]
MFKREEQRAAALINDVLEELGYGRRQLEMRPIPFSGVWGTSSSISYQIANEQLGAELEQLAADLPKKEAKRLVQERIRERAQRIADEVARHLAQRNSFAQVEAVNGYVNIIYDTNHFSNDVVQAAIAQGPDYGRGAPKTDKVMVEFSQPNTHKAFHVGHLRNVALGDALCRILRFAGYDVLAANYIGDIGLHVIKTLWCYLRFHQGEEPPREQRGRWLGEIYAEADRRLNYRQDVVDLLNELAKEDPVFVQAIDRMLKELWRTHKVGEDVAYLLGQIAHGREIKPDAFYDEQTIVRFWPIVGKQLEHELADARAEAEQGLNGESQVSLADLEERYERWKRLASTIDWWPHVPEWQKEVRETFQRWERKDPEFVALWEETRAWSMEEFHRIYDELGVQFDVWFYESEMEDEGRAIVQELLERGIAEVSEGVPVVKIDEKLGLERETYRTLPILRSDGTTLYSTKDLALTKRKFEQYGIDRAIWVVDVRQSLYLQQIFKIMELWGFEQASKCYHLAYETVMLPTGAMSSRSGNVVLYEDIARQVLERALEIIEEKNPSLPADLKVEVARQVGLGSLKYGMLSRDSNRVIVFDIEEALSFDGHAAPYIQYAHARACRILEKVDSLPAGPYTFTDLVPEEIELIAQLAALPDEVERAAEEYKPLIIANYVYELARRFNDFYHACPVLQADEPKRSARIALVAATRQALANGLSLLGIAAPGVM